ncbi:hypothetical protein B0H10DRAFT_2032665 [Mycena sp. CBHHK59/15]|nr:hypothetical protein B0H10DRAFT_2032665 [Mycena sp. CBHHK59/15]
MSDSGEYTALLQHNEGSVMSPHSKETSTPSNSSHSTSRLDRILRLATAVIVCCTVIDMLLILHLGIQQHTAKHAAARADSENLEIKSSYVGLAELYSQTSLKSSKHDPIVNHARAFVQISSTEPSRIFPPYGLMRPIADGMVPEHQRHLLVTPTISTIAQFRVADFGMENCSLSITVPPRSDTKGFLSEEPATLDVWSLPVTKKLDMHKLSWTTRPTGRTFFGSLPISFGETHRLPGRQCLSGSYHTFEFTCSVPDCKIDIMGDGDQASGVLPLFPWLLCCAYPVTLQVYTCINIRPSSSCRLLWELRIIFYVCGHSAVANLQFVSKARGTE